MRFLILTQYFSPEVGAPQVRLAAMIREMRRLGHTVEVVTAMPNHPAGAIFPGYRGRLYRRESWEGVPVHRLWLFTSVGSGLKRIPNYASFTLTSLIGLARARRPDYVFVESPPLFLSIPGFLASRVWGAPVIFNVADLWPDSVRELGVMGDGALLRFAEALERWTYEKARFVNAVTEGIRSTLLQRKGVASTKVLFLPNGVDANLFRPQPPDADLIRALGWEDKKVFLYAGTLGLAHGLGVALEAMRSVQRRSPETKLVLVGGGSDKERLVTMSRQLALGNVEFMDPQPQEFIARLYSIAYAGFACLKNVPLFEGARPSKILPTMASGKVALYSGRGEWARMLEEAEAGLVVSPDDPQALADAMCRLADDPDLAAELGKNGRRYVEAHLGDLGWSGLVERWLAQLEERGRR